MFQSWRQQIRAAKYAFEAGRLEEASQMLRRGNLRDFWPGRKLSHEVADQMFRRATERAALGDTSAGWHDLETAVALDGESDRCHQAREALIAHGLAEAERYLAAAEPERALDRIKKLECHGPISPGARVLRHVAHALDQAQSLARLGKFAEAEAVLAGAESLRPDLALFSARRAECRLKLVEIRRQSAELHRALADRDWPTVLVLAEAILEFAPECAPARQARARAWGIVGMNVTRARGPGRQSWSDSVQQPSAGQFLMWIDAVGGYLVACGDQIVLGRPAADAHADVPILADLSRRHAIIQREGSDYLIEPLRSVKLDGRPVTSLSALADGMLIELGEGVELRFRRPHALSATARLDFVSRHRTEPAADGIVLMAENCVLGPGWQSHVVCRNWRHDLILYRQGQDLFCRTEAPFEVGGQPCTGHATVAHGSRIEGEDFALSIESLSPQQA